MRTAQKKEGQKVKCYILGDGSDMEKRLLASGALRQNGDNYEIVSQESMNNVIDLNHGAVPTKEDYAKAAGEKASKGQHIRVDEKNGSYFPYPAYHTEEEFQKHYRHIEGDTYEQIPTPVEFFQVGDSMADPFIVELLQSKKLTYNADDPEHAWSAHLWSDDLSIPADGAVIIYDRQSLDFGLIRPEEFERDYDYEPSMAQMDMQAAKDYENFLREHNINAEDMDKAQHTGQKSEQWLQDHNFTKDDWAKQVTPMGTACGAAFRQAIEYTKSTMNMQGQAVDIIMNAGKQSEKSKFINIQDIQTNDPSRNNQLG